MPTQTLDGASPGTASHHRRHQPTTHSQATGRLAVNPSNGSRRRRPRPRNDARKSTCSSLGPSTHNASTAPTTACPHGAAGTSDNDSTGDSPCPAAHRQASSTSATDGIPGIPKNVMLSLNDSGCSPASANQSCPEEDTLATHGNGTSNSPRHGRTNGRIHPGSTGHSNHASGRSSTPPDEKTSNALDHSTHASTGQRLRYPSSTPAT